MKRETEGKMGGRGTGEEEEKGKAQSQGWGIRGKRVSIAALRKVI